ncbi:response regulator [Cellulosilyticum ruminicola]|uniref:response regulator n=1 Tax=Cellulosilyticum ruminicola TaxID=425254 RepID=UPI0006D28C50|nr:response regulator [Cellulosilyticum ruminicola]
MLNVQIVDDEPIIRLGLQRLIDWEEMGFEITCIAQNGKQALEQLETERVDLIITDIEMPIMNGLDFIKEVREKDKNIEIVILTAYEDFEYAKTAIRCGITQYILKPIEEKAVMQLLMQIRQDIEEKSVRKHRLI